MKIGIRTLAAASALAAALSLGCEPKPQPIAAAPRARIAFHHYFSGTLSGGIDEMVKTFNQSQSDYELTATALDHESYKTSILDSLRKGPVPELYSYWAGARTQAILDRLAPIDDAWIDEGFDKAFPSIIAESAAEYGGKKYLLPITQHYVAFFYNKAIFERLGLAEPVDWPSFLAACEKIKRAGIIPIALGAKSKWPAQFWFDYLLLRTAGHDYRQRLVTGEASFTDPEVGRSFLIWKQLIDAGYFNQEPISREWDVDAAAMVRTGEAAMTLMGTWIMGVWGGASDAWKPGRDYDAFPFPSIDAETPVAALGPIDGIVVPAACEDPVGAMKALAFFASVPSQVAMSVGSGAFAPRLGVPERIYNPVQLKLAASIAASASWDYNFDLVFEPFEAEAGLEALAEFLRFPELYETVLRDLAGRIAVLRSR